MNRFPVVTYIEEDLREYLIQRVYHTRAPSMSAYIRELIEKDKKETEDALHAELS